LLNQTISLSMSVLRRFAGSQNTSFITCVSFERRPILIEHVDLFWEAIDSVRKRTDFDILAFVVLPDHFHFIVDPHRGDFTAIMQRVKMSFGMNYRKRLAQASGRVWQHRYWDHVIRDQADMNRHIDYIHYNPVKHGLVRSPFDWEHSSARAFLESGLYQLDWGREEPFRFEGEFGE